MRVNISINDDVLADIDKSAKKLGLSRSGYIAVCCELCMIMPFGLSDFETKKRQLIAIFKGDISSDEDSVDDKSEKKPCEWYKKIAQFPATKPKLCSHKLHIFSQSLYIHSLCKFYAILLYIIFLIYASVILKY